MKSELVLLGAAGAVIVLVVAYAMTGQKQGPAQSQVLDQDGGLGKRSRDVFEHTYNDAGNSFLNVVPKAPKTDTIITANAAAALAALGEKAEGTKFEGFLGKVAGGAQKVNTALGTAQGLFGITDEKRAALETKLAMEAAAKSKALATSAFNAAKNKLTSEETKAAAAKAAAAAKSVFSSLGSSLAQGAKSLFQRVHHDTLQKR